MLRMILIEAQPDILYSVSLSENCTIIHLHLTVAIVTDNVYTIPETFNHCGAWGMLKPEPGGIFIFNFLYP